MPLTHGGGIGQVWRGGRRRQAELSRILGGVEVRAIDAAVVLLAENGDEIFTSDPADLSGLARAAGRIVDLIRV